VQQERNGRPAPESAHGSMPRLRAATLEARGVIAAITKCGDEGLLSAARLRELNDIYLHRVELLLEAASVLERSAQTIRLLIGGMERLGRLKPALRSPGHVYVSSPDQGDRGSFQDDLERPRQEPGERERAA
jgi:hypothetical protein